MCIRLHCILHILTSHSYKIKTKYNSSNNLILEEFYEKYLSLYWHILHMITHFGILESNLRSRRLFNLNETILKCALCSHNHSDLVCVNQDYTHQNQYQHKSNQYFPRITDIKLYLRVRPYSDIVFRYIALPVHQLCCVPVRIVFHISDLVEEKTISKSYHSASNA